MRNLALGLLFAASCSPAWAKSKLPMVSDDNGLVLVGDMWIKPGQLIFQDDQRKVPSGAGITPQGASEFGTLLWPGGTLPVAFHKDITDKQREMFWSACRMWSDRARVRCVPRSDSHESWVQVRYGEVCASALGRQGGEQFITLENQSDGGHCWSTGIVAHEIGHALGLVHEHMRPDRDDYIRINWDNIEEKKEGNFLRVVALVGSLYDFDSIMHYGPMSFAVKDAPVFVAQPGFEEAAARAGQRRRLSPGDVNIMTSLYGRLGARSRVPNGGRISCYINPLTGQASSCRVKPNQAAGGGGSRVAGATQTPAPK